MASRYSGSSATGERDNTHESSSTRSARTVTLIPVGDEVNQRTFNSSIGSIIVGRNATNSEPRAQQTPSNNSYITTCPVVSRTHAHIRWLPSGEVVIVDAESHHGTYINDSLSRLTPGQAYKLQDEDTISFGKGIFKDGNFHPPHMVLIRLNTGEPQPRARPSGTYGLKSHRSEVPQHTTPGSQSEAQAEKIRTEVQRLGRRREVAHKHKRQLQDVSSRLDYLEKTALEKSTSPQEVEMRLRALERHYEALLEKLTVIEQNLRAPEHDVASSDGEIRGKKTRADDDGEETDDDEPSQARSSGSSVMGTVAMVVVGGVAVWTALAMS
ncbi:SMAD/FHA domain-containing protein [Serendipita vermifera]|nr:SMAD/FHA domain-containing protein [Serendipita vermifera]